MAFKLIYALCFLLLLLLLPFPTPAQTYHNISLKSSLVAGEDSSPWASPSGEFAFGFQKIGNKGFILAIWFDKIPEKTIVWSANENNLAEEGSTVELNTFGQLVLNYASGEQRLLSDHHSTRGIRVAYAAMLDSGNFVLADKESNNLWESFDQPTDTILPTQTLSIGSVLFAPYTATNYSNGRFQLKLESNGNVVLYIQQTFP
ncbi:putative non-specific serine/threonine protein kinase [Rosa chinensis]|uniref:Putative non-specific serine/threonine protein kinase n=1 Tax=Rosa chinensis TaxID=74649 RepID=A0A2P6QM30_ROSCH|nr:putative non-specific serine/threonine protein kinase [Rosa chinensis]